MRHTIIAYIKYLFYAKSKFAIHSPFVFSLITKSLQKPIEYTFLHKYNLYTTDLLNDSEIIKVTDFGAGSKIFNSDFRKVAKIAKHAGISRKKLNILVPIIRYFKPKNILELGTSLGLSTAAISLSAPQSKIITIEGCPETAKKATFYFKKHKLNNIEQKIGSFTNILPDILQQNKFDLIYFDGNHQKKATISYFENSLQSAHNDTIFVFDDIHWSTEMEGAWEFIKNHQKTSVSIDLFDIGLVFFRKEQVKQNFIIKL